MNPRVVVGPLRASADVTKTLADCGVATVHEALGRSGLLGHRLRPLWPGARVGGTAITVLCAPGDNLMIHVAIEQAQAGDILVITTTSPSQDGFIGELLVTSMVVHGVVGVVTTTGIRDTAEIRKMQFPIWSQSISAQGTVKATAGSVNLPIAIAGTLVEPGDVVVADDDGVVCVPRRDAEPTAAAALQRIEKEAQVREILRSGKLGLDHYGMRPLLERLGVTYVPAGDESES
ncbi:MAG: 4-carboxy-4-hydroxy-2-oxoadipate aldolase/oxaloacetate decarboxylase [Candidatus Dormiibacterota bacterium]